MSCFVAIGLDIPVQVYVESAFKWFGLTSSFLRLRTSILLHPRPSSIKHCCPLCTILIFDKTLTV